MYRKNIFEVGFVYKLAFLYILVLYPVVRHVVQGFADVLVLSQMLALGVFLGYMLTSFRSAVRQREYYAYILIYVFFVAYNVLIMMFWMPPTVYHYGMEGNMFINNIRFLIMLPSWFMVAHYMFRQMAEGVHVLPRWVHVVALLSILLNLGSGWSVDASQLAEYQSTYQTWGDLFAFVGLISIFSAKSVWERWLYVVAYTYFLYAIPSRSSLVAFVLSLLLSQLVLVASWLRFLLVTVFMVLGAMFFLNLTSVLVFLEGLLEGTRHATLLSFEASDSNVARFDTLREGVLAFLENPFFGYYGFQVEKLGDPGLYMHNWFNIMAQLGLIGAFSFLLMLFFYGKSSQNKISFLSDSRKVVLPIFLFSVVSFLVARSHQVAHLYFGVAAMILYVFNRRNIVRVKA